MTREEARNMLDFVVEKRLFTLPAWEAEDALLKQFRFNFGSQIKALEDEIRDLKANLREAEDETERVRIYYRARIEELESR